jgi:glycosyltransferase involved in cell wall biosynthesis
MPVFNEQEYLSKSIESILEQTFEDFEFIIVDDSSTDASREIIEKYASEDKRIRLLCNSVNQGLAVSLNRALSESRGEFIARMDADDIAVGDRLEVQYNFLKEKPDIDLIGSSLYYIDFAGNTIAHYHAITEPEILKKLILYKNISPHPTWMFRRKIISHLRGYRNLPASQDYDFLMRLLKVGYVVSNIDTPLLYYRVHRQKISFDASIVQIKLSRYLRKLYKNGLILNDEFLSRDRIQNITANLKVVKIIHNLSLISFEKGRFLMKGKGILNFLGGGFLLCISAALSPYMAYFIYCGIRAKTIETNERG